MTQSPYFKAAVLTLATTALLLFIAWALSGISDSKYQTDVGPTPDVIVMSEERIHVERPVFQPPVPTPTWRCIYNGQCYTY